MADPKIQFIPTNLVNKFNRKWCSC